VPIVNGDIEVVLMKALRQEPQERYGSVDAFAADLRACLEHRPVQARSGDVWYRTRRFFRSHWIPVAAVASVIIALSAGLYMANRQRMIAEQRFAQLRQLSNRVIDLDLAIRTLPGSIEARRRLVSASLEYLEGLARDAQGNLDLAREISDGYWRMARIQGVNAEMNLGDPAKAEENLKKAETLIESVLAGRPHDRNALFRSALIAHDRMIIAGDERRPEALTHGKHAAERLELFLHLDGRNDRARLEGFLRPGDPAAAERRGASTIFANIGLAFVNEHHFEEGARYARRSVELAEPLSSAPDVAGAGLSVLANALRYQGDLDGALRTIRQARELSDAAQYPNETLRRFARYGPLVREGRILGERDAVNLGRFDEAVTVLQEAFDLNENAARKDPTDASSRSRVGSTARELGDVLRDRDPRRALAIFDLALLRTSQLPENLRNRRERAELLAKSIYPLLLLHRNAEAKKRIDAAVAALQEIHEYPAKRVVLGTPLYSVMRAVADYEAGAGNRQRALEAYEDLLNRTMASKPHPETNLQDAARLSSLYADMAETNRRAGRSDRAADLNGIRLTLWQQWDARLPNNDFVRRQLSAAGGRTGSVMPVTAKSQASV
jgi:tetratricopeptide (TPR) repeat protein